MKEKLVIDRIEGGFAVCLDDEGESFDIALADIDRPQEGFVIRLRSGKYFIDEEEMEKRRKEINALQDDLWE